MVALQVGDIGEPVKSVGFGADPPWQPIPKLDPILPVFPTPPVDVVQIPPAIPVTPTPIPAPAPAPTPLVPIPDPGPAPDHHRPSQRLEAVVVTDADAGPDPAAEARIREVVEGLRRQRGRQLKVRQIDWQDASTRYPLQRDEVPVVLVTNNGRITGDLPPFVIVTVSGVRAGSRGVRFPRKTHDQMLRNNAFWDQSKC